jgi:hypothetical protein
MCIYKITFVYVHIQKPTTFIYMHIRKLHIRKVASINVHIQNFFCKCIQLDESGLTSLEGKLPNRTIRYHFYKIIKEYFEPKYDVVKR